MTLTGQYRGNLLGHIRIKFVFINSSFTDESVKTYILALYNKMDEMKKMGCEVYLLTRGPSIGSQGAD